MKNKSEATVEKKGIEIRKAIIRCTIFLLVFFPSYTFIGIFYANPNFAMYEDNFDLISSKLDSNILPTPLPMTIFLWLGFSLFILSIGHLIFISLIFKKHAKNKILKNIFLAWMITIFLASSLFFTLSEYNYSRFYDIYTYIKNMKTTDDKEFNSIINYYAQNYSEGWNFKWSSDIFSWLICIFQIMVIMIQFSMFNSSISSKEVNVEETNKTSTINSVGYGKIGAFVGKITGNTNKNISLWLLICSMLVFIPQLIFIIILESESSMGFSLLEWTFIASFLLKNEVPEFYEKTSKIDASYVVIGHLPLIATGFLAATICIFLIIYIKRINISKSFFITQFAIMAAELVLVLAVNTYTIYEINKIVDVWNEYNLAELVKPYVDSIPFLSQNIVNGNISYPWLYGEQYISLLIISLAFTGVSFTMLTSKSKKIFKNNKTL
ncbi:hypothetical protein SHELI_v1c11000 [Spiroplasma helicoides]|uniref:Uncharacterized protein n=1 Tax=Spiroplasma helicoides TaxID=216938 RepID=A0A1B3SMA8_9MOLU|nr:hypothetical protein [Spiroplasma helicoides]AOG61047.1 hypothetical protein SHELI_v1c11000 [Spiroplasma helicoides]